MWKALARHTEGDQDYICSCSFSPHTQYIEPKASLGLNWCREENKWSKHWRFEVVWCKSCLLAYFCAVLVVYARDGCTIGLYVALYWIWLNSTMKNILPRASYQYVPGTTTTLEKIKARGKLRAQPRKSIRLVSSTLFEFCRFRSWLPYIRNHHPARGSTTTLVRAIQNYLNTHNTQLADINSGECMIPPAPGDFLVTVGGPRAYKNTNFVGSSRAECTVLAIFFFKLK